MIDWAVSWKVVWGLGFEELFVLELPLPGTQVLSVQSAMLSLA